MNYEDYRMIELAEKANCTGCMNCLESCRSGAISVLKDNMDNVYPVIDRLKCIECGMCVRACPALNKISLSRPVKCYAAYSIENNTRRFSASGGVASAIYKLCIAQGNAFAGVYFDTDSLTARYGLGTTAEDITLFRNSKYTFSFMDSICEKVLEEMKSRIVFFVGLPCHTAALKRYMQEKEADFKRLVIIDLICHGVPSHVYLIDHIKNAVHADKVDSLCFRDEKYQTSKFVFSVSHDKKQYYKFVESNDNYQIGYHSAAIYRPNCYNCYYAKLERTGDLTIGDFTGFGRCVSYEGDVRKEKYLGISCILVNTEKGGALVNELVEKKLLKCFERPLEEAFLYEQQLRSPSKPSSTRPMFERLYPQYGFTKTLNRILKKEKIKRVIIKFTKDCVKFMLRRK